MAVSVCCMYAVVCFRLPLVQWKTGAVVLQDASMDATRCSFKRNVASLGILGQQGGGAALFAYRSQFRGSDCTFELNRSPRAFGGACNLQGGANFECARCNFLHNSAFSRGAAIYASSGSRMAPTDCNFHKNEAVASWGFENNRVAIYLNGAAMDCDKCRFSSSQPESTIVHLAGCSKLSMQGEVEFAPPVPGTTSIQSESSSSFQLSNAALLLGESAKLLLSGTVQMDRAAIELKGMHTRTHARTHARTHTGSNPLSSAKIHFKTGAVVDLKHSWFKGLGNITVAAGAKIQEVSNCSFADSARWSFDAMDKTTIHKYARDASTRACLTLAHLQVAKC